MNCRGTIKISKAITKDAGAILELQKLAYQSEAMLYNNFTISPLIQTLEDIKKQFCNHIFLKAVLFNTIIGSVRAYENRGTCYIGRLIVNPDNQNKGIGKRLMSEIEGCFSRVNRFELFTGSKSLKTISLYKKLGYRIINSEKINNDLEFVYLEKLKTI